MERLSKLVRSIWDWWGIMSGSLSIPFLAVGLILSPDHYETKTAFLILAYLSVWGFAIKKGSEHKQEMVSIKSDLAKLKDQLDERQRRRDIKKALALCHIALINRLQAIKSMGSSYLAYCQKYPESFEKKEIDPDTASQIVATSNLVDLHLGLAHVAIFNDSSDFQFDQSPYTSAFGREQQIFRDWALAVIRHRAAKLKEIINSIPDQ